MNLPSLVIVAGSTLLALVLPPIVSPVLRRKGVVDRPNARSSHSIPTVRGAGLASLIALVAGLGALIALGDAQAELMGILLIAATASVLGFVEDVRGVSTLHRAALQVLIGVAGVAYFHFAWQPMPVIAMPVAVIFIAGYINVANFMDGINGVSGLHGGLVGGCYALIGFLSGTPWLIFAGLLLAGIFLAFLPWNIPVGRMFLGDVGSYLLGAAVSAVVIVGALSGISVVSLLGPLTIYLADTFVTLLRRALRGENWLEAHRSHIYQRLTIVVGSHGLVALLVTLMSAMGAVGGLLALAGTATATFTALMVMAGTAAAYVALPAMARLAGRHMKRTST